MGSGLGLTETAGFCTYTDVNAQVEDIAKSIGFDMPLFPISIRKPMNTNDTAGDQLRPGEVGKICFSGPQVFLGYLGDAENTKKTVSSDGVCYTGDLGYYDNAGLHFSGRPKLVIKPKGYQVYPDDIANHITEKLKDRVANVAIVGVEHEMFTEGVMAFVEKIEGKNVTVAEIMEVCKEIASYARPSHIEILSSREMPLNRVGKTDFMVLKDKVKDIVKKLRSEGGWDS